MNFCTSAQRLAPICFWTIAAKASGAEDLRRRLSEVCDEIQASQMLPRVVSVFNGGGSAHFELECPLDDQKHLG